MTAVRIAEATVRRVFAQAGVRGWLYAHAVSAGGPAGAEVAVDADESVPLASIYKLPLLVAYLRAVDAGLDPTARTSLPAADRSPGAAGISLLQDRVTMSWRDLVTSMIAMSDNAAADAVFRKVGAERVRQAMAALDLPTTHVQGDTRAELASLLSSTWTTTSDDAFGRLADVDRPTVDYRRLSGSTSTPREITRLLVALWTDAAASEEQCAFARAALSRRVGSLRLRLGFPLDVVTVAEKSGTLGALRHTAGVLGFPGEPPYAVTVFTQAARADRILPAAEAAVGGAARVAVDALRCGPTPR